MAIVNRNADPAGGLGDGTVLVGSKPAPRRTEVAKLRLDPVHNFSFLWHPGQWDVAIVEEKAQLVPRLREFHYEPGLACVEPVKNELDGDPDNALRLQARRGWREIPRAGTFTAWNRTFDDYVHVFDGYRGPVHLSVWRQPFVLGGKVMLDFDEDGWNAWRVSLIGSVIPNPDRSTRRALELQFRVLLNKLQTSGERNALAISKAELVEQKMAAFAVAGAGPKRGAPEGTAPAGSRPKAPPKAKPGEDPEGGAGAAGAGDKSGGQS